MKIIINGTPYEEITSDPSPDGDDKLLQTVDGEFFLQVGSTFLDGKKLKPWESVEDFAPEICPGTAPVYGEAQRLERRRRIRHKTKLVSLTQRDAVVAAGLNV